MKDLIRKEHFYNFPIEKVWHAITDAEEISDWFLKADFKAEKGYPYTLTHETTVISGVIIEANPVTELIYTWKVSGTNVDTTVKWILEEKNGGTFLVIEHSGISNYDGETAIKMFENFKDGWQNCIEKLHEFLDKTVNV